MSYKEADTDGMPYIVVNAAAIEVDKVTFDRVAVGDKVRVRYTRDAKAISIDRIIEGARQNGSDITPR